MESDSPDVLVVLAEPNRRRLLALLGQGERTVTELAGHFEVSRSAISQHLSVMTKAGLVTVRKDGRFRRYRLDPAGLGALRIEIDHFWTAEVDALARDGSRTSEVVPMSFDRSVFIPVSPDEAFAMVTEPERLRRWHTVAAQIDLRAGGDYRFTVVPGYIAAGKVVEADPGKRLVLSWGWEQDPGLQPGESTVTITLAPGDGGTFVRLTHEGLTETQSTSHAEGWNHYLDRLVAYATDGDAGPDEWTMAPDPVDELVAAEASLAACQRVADQITDDDLGRPTPCKDFTVGQLADHLLGSLSGLGSMTGSEVAVAEEGPLGTRIATTGSAAIAAWRARGLDGTVAIGPNEMPASSAAGIMALELLVHAWDLASATGGTAETGPEIADFVKGLAERVVTPAGRDGDRFAAEVIVAESADAMDRLVAFTGRQP